MLKREIKIGILTFLAYMAAYNVRNMVSAFIPLISAENVFSLEALGSMGGAFFLIYGIGQLINGYAGNKVAVKHMLFTGLFLSGILMILFPLCRSSTSAILLWGACGFLCSMLWAPITRFVGENTDFNSGYKILTALSLASNLGLVTAYGFAIIGSQSGNWKTGFYAAGAFIISISIIWFTGALHIEKTGQKLSAHKQTDEDKPPEQVRYITFGFLMIAFVTILNGIVRNTIAFWIPVFVADILQTSNVVFISSIAAAAPFVNVAGIFFTVIIYRLLGRNEFKLLLSLSVTSVVMFIIMLLLGDKLPVLSIVSLFIAGACMGGITNAIFSIFVLNFTKTGKLSGISGFLNFLSYVSGAGASFVFAGILYNGWFLIITIWLIAAFLTIVLSYFAYRYYKSRLYIKLVQYEH